MSNSKIVDRLFFSMKRPGLAGKAKTVYTLLGVAGAIILVTSMNSSEPLRNLIGSSICVYAMIVWGAVCEIKALSKKKYVNSGGVVRDIAVAVIWTLLMLAWLWMDIL